MTSAGPAASGASQGAERALCQPCTIAGKCRTARCTRTMIINVLVYDLARGFQHVHEFGAEVIGGLHAIDTCEHMYSCRRS